MLGHDDIAANPESVLPPRLFQSAFERTLGRRRLQQRLTPVTTEGAEVEVTSLLVGSVLIWPRQGLSRKPLPSPGNLLPSERLGFRPPMPSEQADANAVLSLNAQANKFHWHWFAKYQRACCCVTAVQVHVAVRSYIARKTNRIPRRNRERWLSDGPLNQPLHFVVIVVKEFLVLTVAVESLFCHVAEELNILKTKEITGISYRYGKVKP